MANERARALRKNQTKAEKKLWRCLRLLKSDGFHFRRQVPIDGLIVDFACYAARLVIEVDGGQHARQSGMRSDKRRDAHLIKQDFRVLRFWNHDVLQNVDGVMQVIQASLVTPTPNPSPQGGGILL